MKKAIHTQAFPIIGGTAEYHYGMSLRDYFAAKAMQGLCSACNTDGEVHYQEEAVVESAYKMADAMLAERAK